jgi:hypothetical protein
MPQFTPGDWHLVEIGDNSYYPYAQIRSSERSDFYVVEMGLGGESASEDRANLRVMTEAVRMYELLNEMVNATVHLPEWRDRARAIINAVDGTVPCGATVSCVHDSDNVCVVAWVHTLHRTECGCREPVAAVNLCSTVTGRLSSTTRVSLHA